MTNVVIIINVAGELPDRQQEHLKQNFMSGVVEDQDAPPVPPQCFWSFNAYILHIVIKLYIMKKIPGNSF